LTKALAAIGLGILLLTQPVWVAAGEPGDQVRQSVDKLLAILEDPRLKEEGKKNERPGKLKKVIYQRFDFTEMARRSLGPEWRRHNPEEQKDFVKLFTDLLERAYREQIESYNDQKVQYVNEREDLAMQRWTRRSLTTKGKNFRLSTGSTT
jgi:phospholipid transport system substrate-binding protein